MRVIKSLAISFFIFSLTHLSAEETVEFSSSNQQTIMVELFTSQGCSSCPPAEHWLNTFENNAKLWKEIVPIAFHVDYWDRLGWPDVYADEAYTARQYRHRAQNNIRSVYTPGVIVNGQEWRGWIRGKNFPQANPNAGILSFKADSNKVYVDYSEKSNNVVLNVALLGVGIETKIDRGENKNRTLKQEFVALTHNVYTPNNGQWEINLPTHNSTDAKRYALAIWVSRANDISPIQSTGYWIPNEWVQS